MGKFPKFVTIFVVQLPENQFIDKEVEVLFEENDDKYYKGHTSNYIMVKSLTNEKIQNELRRVKIKEEKNLELVGTLL